MMPKILFCGHGRSGKDTACEYFSQVTGLKNAGTTSLALAKVMAAKLNLPEDEAYRRRRESDEMRMLWFNTGNEIRANDPSLLVRTMFEIGDVSGGCRGEPEIRAVRRLGLADLIVWVERDVPYDPTMEFGPEYADIVIQNTSTINDFYSRLLRLARFAGLLKQES